MTIHLVIPDGHVKEGVDLSHWTAIGNFIVDKHPDVIVNLGDFADMPSLSSYDVGKKEFEGRRYIKDIATVDYAQKLLFYPLHKYNSKQRRTKHKVYKPRQVLTLGNHEQRIARAVSKDSKLDGLIKYSDLKYEDYGWEVHDFLEVVEIDGIHYCLEENHKVLTKDLRYVKLKDVEVGEELVSFEEFPEKGKGRKYKTGTVTKKLITPAPVFTVTLNTGKTFTVTADHRWLVRSNKGMEWKHTTELTLGSCIPKYFDTWESIDSYRAGWLSGMFDGEGSLSKPNTKQGGIQLHISQNKGITFETLKSTISWFGFDVAHTPTESCQHLRINGTSAEKVRFLGSIRPERLINKFKPEMLGRMQSIEDCFVVSIVKEDEQRNIVQIETTTATLIVDGFAHHNCHYFTSGIMGNPAASAKALLRAECRSCVMGHVQKMELEWHNKRNYFSLFAGIAYPHYEEYLGKQGNQLLPGVWLLHNVREGQAEPQWISLETLKKDYL